MSVMFHVWNAVISLSTAEPKSAMHNGDWGNRGVGNREWSGVERNGVERSGIRIIRIKIKEKCDIIASTFNFYTSNTTDFNMEFNIEEYFTAPEPLSPTISSFEDWLDSISVTTCDKIVVRIRS